VSFGGLSPPDGPADGVTRTLIVSLDGATLGLVHRWSAEGRMPTLTSLMADGSFAEMRSTFPFNSAVAWTSLATGATAGRHGIYDFFLLREGSYGVRPATSSDRLVPAIWNIASGAGARVAVLNVPVTYPAEQINGVMVSGMDSPALDDHAVHPEGYLSDLRHISPSYVIVSKATKAATRGDFDQVERELLLTLRARTAVALSLARPRDLDLLIVNLETTEKSHHFFWQHHDPSHPRYDPATPARWRDAIARVYQAVDIEIGRLIDAFSPDTVFVLSDRGAGPSKDWVLFVNDWLAAEGFIELGQGRRGTLLRRLHRAAIRGLSVPARRRLRGMAGGAVGRVKDTSLYGGVDWSETRAYAQLRSSIRLNLAGREPAGIVRPAESEELLAQVAARALELRLPTGEPVFTEARSGLEVYPGGAPGGPDLVMYPVHGLQIKGRNISGEPGFLHRPDRAGAYLPSGVHTDIGMVVAAGSGIGRVGAAALTDIRQSAPSILSVMGIPLPGSDLPPFPFVVGTLPPA
jgi:predicted AlkP superfamily phosphohydrolase/phosphomutase